MRGCIRLSGRLYCGRAPAISQHLEHRALRIYTHDIAAAEPLLPQRSTAWSPLTTGDDPLRPIAREIFGDREIREATWDGSSLWRHLLVVGHAPRSQYDLLIDLARRERPPPHATLCLAAGGDGFHGHAGRAWAAPHGNLYLSAYLSPEIGVERAGCGFVVLAALSVVDAVDALLGARSGTGIKWVNDVLVDGAKVAGVLAHTQVKGDRVEAAVLGIGLNVETTPRVPPDPFVPRVASLSDLAPGCTRRDALDALLRALDRNYRLLQRAGAAPLLERYRSRSLVLGREVEVDGTHGRVHAIGENLELYLEGRERPVVRGRLILADPQPALPGEIYRHGS
jgi:BirA family biotin operon repressor/biotin-[acetyl-CoA-carboxylase] ligase